ncbi:hypothetical protein RI367_008401 [Sorochytrium milnesiophthora]
MSVPAPGDKNPRTAPRLEVARSATFAGAMVNNGGMSGAVSLAPPEMRTSPTGTSRASKRFFTFQRGMSRSSLDSRMTSESDELLAQGILTGSKATWRTYLLQIRTVVVFLWMLTIFIASATLISLSYIFSQEQITDATSTTLSLYGSGLSKEIDTQLKLVVELVYINQRVFSSNLLNTTDTFTFSNFFYGEIRSFLQTSNPVARNIIVTTPSYYMYGIDSRNSSGQNQINLLTSTSGVCSIIALDTTVSDLSYMTLSTPTDLVQLTANPIWYSVVDSIAQSTQTGRWTDPFAWYHDISIAYSAPLYDQRNTFTGVLTTRFSLTTFDSLVTNVLSLNNNSLSDADFAVFTAGGVLLGNTFGFPSMSCSTAICAASDIKTIRQYNNTYMAALHQCIISTFGSYGNIGKQASPCTPTIGTSLYLLYVSPVTSSALTSQWYMASFVPRSSMYSQSDRNQTLLMAISAVVGFFVMAISTPLFNSVIRPLISIKDEMIGIFVNSSTEADSDEMDLVHGEPSVLEANTTSPHLGGGSAQHPEHVAGTTTTTMATATAASALPPPPVHRERMKLSLLTEIRELQAAFARMKKVINAFEKFVPRQSVRAILYDEPWASQLHVDRRNVGIFFSDIKDFTTLAENMPSEQLIHLLAQYFAAMTKKLDLYHGVVGDFIGDAIMAFFNAPDQFPDFAAKTIQCAIEQQRALVLLNKKLRAQGLPQLTVRMAVHCGEVHAGNIGSRLRLKYGLVGDAVNLTSRMEGLCKRYGIRLLASQDLLLAAKQDCEFPNRPLETVVVKGRKGSITVHEVLVDPSDAELEKCERFTALFDTFYDPQIDWENVENVNTLQDAITEYLKDYPRDLAAELMLSKVERGELGGETKLTEK